MHSRGVTTFNYGRSIFKKENIKVHALGAIHTLECFEYIKDSFAYTKGAFVIFEKIRFQNTTATKNIGATAVHGQ